MWIELKLIPSELQTDFDADITIVNLFQLDQNQPEWQCGNYLSNQNLYDCFEGLSWSHNYFFAANNIRVASTHALAFYLQEVFN